MAEEEESEMLHGVVAWDLESAKEAGELSRYSQASTMYDKADSSYGLGNVSWRLF